MTRKEAEKMTNLDSRENLDAKYEYLRCQLGEESSTRVQTSAFRSINTSVFRLIAFGEDWDRAVGMWQVLQKQKQGV